MSLLLAYLIASAGPLLQAVLLTLQTWENRRFVRGRAQGQMPGQRGRVAIIAPCKGLDVDLATNLKRLFEQDHQNYEIVFVVDSPDDPAFPILQTLARDNPGVKARVVVSGKAALSSQKIHNLRHAIGLLDPAVKFLAFVDSDAQPRRDWLRNLVRRLGHDGAEASTSYRWFVPMRNTLPNLLLASLDHSLAPLVGPRLHHLVWGGSWAIRRDVYHDIGLDEAWSTALSDDLVASRLLAAAGATVEYEPMAMVASPLDVNWRDMYRFVRRQFAVVRWHEPRWWFVGLVLSVLNQLFFWASALGGAALLAAGNPLARPLLGAAAAIYALHIVRTILRQSAARSFVPDYRERLSAAHVFDIVLHPLASALNACGLLGSAWSREIRWRGIHYSPREDGAVAGAPIEPRADESPVNVVKWIASRRPAPVGSELGRKVA